MMAEFGQDGVEHDAAERIVLDAEHPQRLRRRRERIGIAACTTAFAGLARASITVSVKVVPPPRRGVMTISPPIARASCLTEDNPSPAPPKREAMLTLACENGRNSRLISAKRQANSAVGNREGDADLALASPRTRRHR